MASPLELDIDCKTNGYSMLVNSSGDEFQQTLKVKEFLDRLEEERLKIDAFKRELPLCMQLLNNAVEAFRQRLESYQAKQGTKEFIPLKNSTVENSEKASNTSEKTSWMTTAQLWSHANDGSECKAAKTPSVEEFEQGLSTNPKLSLDHKERNGAFLPFSKERSISANPSEIARASVDKEIEEKKCFGLENRMSHRIGENRKGVSGMAVERGKGMGNASEVKATPQTQRKARRCWSPELHHRFVNALRVLGGSEVATPKQIRELMKVDGLTNDEVKSHLQKYRLHTRRPGPTSPSPATQPPHLVVLGGIWVPPEYAAAPTIYGPHPAAMAHYCPPVPQDFYPVPPHHYHPYNNASPQTQSSPESNDRDALGRSESMEEGGKSESESWKGRRSGKEEGMVARGLLSLKDSGEEEGESHASGITLKI